MRRLLRRLYARQAAARYTYELPSRGLRDLFPGVEDVDVTYPAREILRARSMVMPAPELLSIGAVCRLRQPRRVFEIGTYTGSTTLVMARNSAPDAEVATLDLPPTSRFVVGEAYQGTPEAARIVQHFGDSSTFDFTPWYGMMDLVLVDADHRYDPVKRDSATALRLVRPGGVIIWDDYVWTAEFPECAGVSQYLHELARSVPCYRLTGTRLAVHISA